jgi:protein TonB
MECPARLACNGGIMLHKPLPRRPEAVPAAPAIPAQEAVLVDVVVLSADAELFQAARDAVGERNPVWRARSAEEAANLLITGRCGVLVIDMAAVSTRADMLIEQIVEQFPDVVVCVAGTRGDEPLLAPLISHGLVYRFMHKPTSARRAGMFLQAAIRRHVERREGRQASDPLLPLLRGFRRPASGMPRGYLVLIGLATIALTVPLFIGGSPEVSELPATDSRPLVTAPAPSTAVRADPVLSRARAALQAGRLEAPEGRNALDLFHGVLLAQPDHPEARTSLGRTIDLLLARAQQEADAGRKAEAERLLQRVLAVVPDHRAAQALASRINPPDTPSRQLSREQRAEVESQLAATAMSAPATVAVARMKTLQEIEAELAALPGPVTTLSRASRTPAAVTPAFVPAVQPDPLAPRFTNAVRTPGPLTRSYAREIANPLPTAAIVAPAVASESAMTSPAAGEPMAPGVVAADQLDRVVTRDPVYPPQALRNGTKGWVELEFTITPNGTVRDIQVVAAEPRGVFDGAASDAVAAWRFRPRVVNGQPVAQRSTITMHFDVDT